MKRLLPLLALLIVAAPAAFAGGKSKAKATPVAAAVDDKEIHWMNIDQVQVAMKKAPKKVWVDVYTGWCGWCKKMDATTYKNPSVVRYINEHFYAVRLDAEQKDSIRFMGKSYGYIGGERGGVNQFANELLQGQLSYPTSVFMAEHFQGPQPVPGYQDVPTIEMILKYLAEEHYKQTPFDEWQKSFKASWTAAN